MAGRRDRSERGNGLTVRPIDARRSEALKTWPVQGRDMSKATKIVVGTVGVSAALALILILAILLG